MRTKLIQKSSRYKCIDGIAIKRICIAVLLAALITGCGKSEEVSEDVESATDSHIDFQKLKEENSDIFAWIHIPDTEIDYPILQNQEGDDDFYVTHNAHKKEDPKGAIHIEATNLADMCDFNEVVHGSSPDDGTMFAGLSNFLDRDYFEDHQYIYVYMDGNALVYCVMAAFIRDNTRLVEQYDFSYAYGCQEFIDEIYSGRSMTKNVREGWDKGLSPKHFIITLSTVSPQMPDKQIVVIGCLVGDVAGNIDRVIDWSEPESN